MCDITVILPTYNESENIGSLIEGIFQVMRGWDIEILVVDDDSPDGTSECVESMRAHHERLRLITRRQDHGLVPSIWEGIQSARGDIIVWLDADNSMQPAVIPQLVSKVREGADMAFGSRYTRGGRGKGGQENHWNFVELFKAIRKSQDSFWAVLASVLGNLTVRHFLDRRFHDYTSGFYAIRKPVFQTIELEGFYLDYCIRLLYKACVHDFKVVEVPMTVFARQKGESKTSSSIRDLVPILLHCFHAVVELRSYARQHGKKAVTRK
ncbi:MAG: glycosyltransferase [Magnetococcales bacterium]|nr:glycosyltransferase [Magnetococcales bacterium]